MAAPTSFQPVNAFPAKTLYSATATTDAGRLWEKKDGATPAPPKRAVVILIAFAGPDVCLKCLAMTRDLFRKSPGARESWTNRCRSLDRFMLFCD